MPLTGRPRPGRGRARTAARQAAVLFGLSGVSAFAALPSEAQNGGRLALVGALDLLTALVAWVLPWDRWGRWGSTAWLALPGFAVLGLATWTFGGYAAGTGPFFVLIFAWLGLHHRPWTVVACALPATVAYLAPLIVVGSPPRVLSSAVVLVPVGVGIGLVVAGRVRDLREQRDRAERAEDWRSALMATLAHDIRSPLTTVETTLLVLDEAPELPRDRRAAMIGAALRQTRRLTRLASGLLDLERVEQGALRLDRGWVPVDDVVDEAAALVPTGAAVARHVEPGLRVHADAERLEQVVINLLTNAVRHGQPPVVLTAERAAGGVRLTVRDHGPGVAEDRRATLFDRLGGDAGHPDSVGLGMWIVRLLVEAHGGTVRYEPARPGARFTVWLPGEDLEGAPGGQPWAMSTNRE